MVCMVNIPVFKTFGLINRLYLQNRFITHQLFIYGEQPHISFFCRHNAGGSRGIGCRGGGEP